MIAFVEARRGQLIQVAQTLIQQKSTNPPGDVSKTASAAVTVIKQLIPDAEISTYQTGPGIVNVVAIIRGSGIGPARRLLFSGHLDTYPLGDVDKWSVSPLEGVVDERTDRLYGRGSSDMKGGIAASILAACALAYYRETWSGEVILALAGDEETMGQLGSAYLLKHVDSVRLADAVICGDAGSPNVIRVGEKGLLWLELTATGVPAHGAHVHRGVNAIERLMEALTALKTLEMLPINIATEVRSTINDAKAISEELGGVGEADVLQRVTVNIGKISGGTSPNLVPDKAQASLDIRLPVGITTAELGGHIQACLAPIGGISYEIQNRYEPSWTSPSEQIVQDTKHAVDKVLGQNHVLNARVGASDTRLFRQAGIPSVVVGLTPNNMGGPDEYLLIEELLQVCQIHTLAAWRFLGSRA